MYELWFTAGEPTVSAVAMGLVYSTELLEF